VSVDDHGLYETPLSSATCPLKNMNIVNLFRHGGSNTNTYMYRPNRKFDAPELTAVKLLHSDIELSKTICCIKPKPTKPTKIKPTKIPPMRQTKTITFGSNTKRKQSRVV